MKSLISAWNTDTFLYKWLLAWKELLLLGLFIKARKLMIFANKTMRFVGKR